MPGIYKTKNTVEGTEMCKNLQEELLQLKVDRNRLDVENKEMQAMIEYNFQMEGLNISRKI